MNRWKALIILGMAQFLMVLDASVMNVSISQLVIDFDTEVTAIQAVITLYTLVMAAFMITGGKLADMFGRRRVFAGGLVVYGVGSALTAVAPTLGVLALGWSVIEGFGAALVLPALAALVASTYQGRDRAVSYGVIGGLAGAGIAVGPLLGGWVTTYLTWRLVFAGEAVLVVVILLLIRWITPQPAPATRPRLDLGGVLLSVAGLALVVLAVLQSSSWGWLHPRNPPFTVFGFSPTVFVIALGLVLLYLLRLWEEHRADPLVRFSLFRIPSLRSGLLMLFSQNVILLGLFFAIPLYLQVVLGLNAFETGLRLLPVSVTMLVAALSGPALNRFVSPRTVVRTGLLVLFAATLWLLGTIEPELDDLSFALAMALLGLGMGLLASQLGNVVQSSVGESERSEVGGLQYTAQNLGSSLGTALIGAIVISALAAAFTAAMAKDPAVSETVRQQAGIRIESGLNFVPADQAAAALAKTPIPPEEADAVVSAYRTAQLDGLKVAVLAAAGITLAGFPFTRRLPATGSGYGRVPAPTRGTPPGGPGDSTEQHEELP
ncbi:MFS transporter [Kitasatospora aureofaciens]|uniref:MFS transporter n=1 Tax=Kitasatospora aureofaciens TaxID=1894 RepID=UPI000A59337D|nr:MFS transporter [Streptomyces viridifaciens]